MRFYGWLRQGDAGRQAGGERGEAFEEGVYRVKRLSLLAEALLYRPGSTGQLHEEQSGAILPGGHNSGVEGQFPVAGGGEGSFLHEGDEIDGGFHAEMVVESQDEGIPATAAVEAAVVAAAERRGRETGREFGPGMASGHFPEDGIQQEARRGAGTTGPYPDPPQIKGQIWGGRRNDREALEGFVVLLQDDKVLEVAGIRVVGEIPAIGGNDDRRVRQ